MVRKEGIYWRVQIQRGGAKHSTTFPTKREAEGYEAKVIEDHRNGRAGLTTEKTLKEALLKYLDETVEFQKADAKTTNHVAQIRPFVEGRAITEINEVWQEYIKFASQPRTIMRYHSVKNPDGVPITQKPASNATINRKGAALRRVSNLAYNTWHWLKVPIHIELLPEPKGSHTKTTIRVADFPLFLSKIPDQESIAMMMVLMYTGMRIGEALKLAGVENGYFVLYDTKNSNNHSIKVHPDLIPWIKYIPFKYQYKYYYGRFVIAREAVGRPDLTPHKLRHSFATHLLNKGEKIEVVSRLLNHSDISITMRHYGDVYREVLDNAIDRF